LQEGFEEAISSVQKSTVDEMASWREPVEAAEAVVEAVQELRSSAVGIVAAVRASSSGGGYRAAAAAAADNDAEMSAIGIVAAARASSAGGAIQRVSAAGAADDAAVTDDAAAKEKDVEAAAQEAEPVPMTPAAAIKDVTFVTPRSSFSGGDQGPGQRRRAARWARDSGTNLGNAVAAAAAAGSPGLLRGSIAAAAAAVTPHHVSRRVSDSMADVAAPGDSCGSAAKARAGSLSASVQRWQDKQQQQQPYEKTPTPARNAVAGIEARILAKIATVCSPTVGRRSVAVSSAGAAGDDAGHGIGGKPAWKE
jgi:hypothetical protein